jgi:hypothetical protein
MKVEKKRNKIEVKGSFEKINKNKLGEVREKKM